MNKQEAIQLLEEMGLDAKERCPYCNEILINKIKKTKNIVGSSMAYRCSHCGQIFRLITCSRCNLRKYAYYLNLCKMCFSRSKLQTLVQKKEKIERDYKKIILIKSRKKPDIKFTITNDMFRKIKLECLKLKITPAYFVYKTIEEKLES